MTELEQRGAAASTSTPTEPEHEFLAPLAKRVRALKKKVSNVAEIEAKLKAGSKINADQQQVLDSKDGLVKSLAELESLHAQYVKVQQQSEKLQKRLKKKSAADADAEKERERAEAVRQIVELFQASHLLDQAAGPRVLADMLVGKGADAVPLALKYIARTTDELVPGVSFKSVAEQVAVTVAPPAAVVEDATEAEPQAQPEQAPVEHDDAAVPAEAAEPTEPASESAAEPVDEPAGFETAAAELDSGVGSSIGEWGATPVDEPATDNGGWSSVGETSNGAAQHAGRGRGRGSYRGDRPPRGGRGEYRGGFRGRGDGQDRPRGEYRGRGGYQDRPRGEYRGRGGFRGRGDGQDRPRGEYRGRGSRGGATSTE